MLSLLVSEKGILSRLLTTQLALVALVGGCAIGTSKSPTGAPTDVDGGASNTPGERPGEAVDDFDAGGECTGEFATLDATACTEVEPDGGAACTDDADDDGVNDCEDECPNDSTTSESGPCGCGVAPENRQEDCSCEPGFIDVADACVKTCGNGVVEAPETCDDGNADNTDSCPECSTATCGDGWVQMGQEVCDGDAAGEAGETPTCNANCTAASCGDGVVNAAAGEQCDVGVTPPTQTKTCEANCKTSVCGDQLVNPLFGEFCDDGNDTAGDGCDACYRENRQLGTEVRTVLVDDGTANAETLLERPCPDGYAATAVVGNSAEALHRLGVRCSQLDSNFRFTGATPRPVRLGSIPAGSTLLTPLACPRGELLVAIALGYSEGRFRVVQGFCRTPAAVAAEFDNAAGTTSTALHDTSGGMTPLAARLTCPSGFAVTGVNGHVALDNQTVSSLSLFCRALVE